MASHKYNTHISVAIALFSLIFIAFSSDPDFIRDLKSQLKKYTSSVPSERVYIQTDKPMYLPGEDIWLSAFLVDAQNSLSEISEIVYVELIDPRGNIMHKLTLPAQGGTAKGDFSLDENIAGGIYKIRAYTLWMRNFSNEILFEKEIHIQHVIPQNLLLKLDFEKENYNPGDEAVATFESRDLSDRPIQNTLLEVQISYNGKQFENKTAYTDSIGKANIILTVPDTLTSRDGLLNIKISYNGQTEAISRAIPISLRNIKLSFYPEGGHIISNMPNKVAFEALNEFGKPIDIEGALYSGEGNRIGSFSSFHMGMGKFDIPNAGKGYYVKITHPVLEKDSFSLPDPVGHGYQLCLKENNRNKLTFHVQVPGNTKGYLTGHLNGEICFDKKITGKKNGEEIVVDCSDNPAGIIVFTLFDADRTEMCERLAFINQDKQMKVEVTPSKKRYQTREKVKLSIKTSDENNNPIRAHLSMAVVDDRIISFADDKQDHLTSYLLLSSELKGHIEEPTFYFDPEEPKANEALDLLMMTHGWRRFSWKDVFGPVPELVYAPEDFNRITGLVLNTKTNKPVKANVYLLEMNNQNRIAKVKTGNDGIFKFYNIDPTATFEIVAMSGFKNEKHWQIKLNSQAPVKQTHTTLETSGFKLKENYKFVPEIINQTFTQSMDYSEPLQTIGSSVVLDEDICAMSEIVVIGYGTVKKQSLTGSVTYNDNNEIVNRPEMPVEALFSGRAAGVTVINQSGSPGTDISVKIRGSNSLANTNPVYIIDGVVVNISDGDQSEISDFVNPENIERISIVKSPLASGLVGQRASNGVIIIETKDYNRYQYGNYITPRKNFANLRINNYLKRSVVREFYVPDYEKENNSVKNDQRKTIYWNPDIQTDSDGNAEVEFYTSDAMTTFRITTEGIGNEGLPGRNETTFVAGDPVNLDMKLPAYAVKSDSLKLPVQIFNTSDEPVKGTLSLSTDETFIVCHDGRVDVTIPPGSSVEKLIPCFMKQPGNSATVHIRFQNDKIDKHQEKSINIYPRGFIERLSLSGITKSASYTFDLNHPEPGTLQAGFVAYSDQMSELFAGLESMLREPHGCFEQVSSSTYPNILVLQLLKELRLNNPEIEGKALAYISEGYSLLKKYKVLGGGYSWFGGPPAHEGLTAYGLMEFIEMKRVYDKVDEKIIENAKNWLLKRRDGKGGFDIHKGKYGFYGASQEVSNAYIVYALAFSGEKSIEPEYQKALDEALNSKDAYRLALMLNASWYLDKSTDYETLSNLIVGLIKNEGISNLKASQSIVRSYGNSLKNEVISLTLLGLLKEEHSNIEIVKMLFSELMSKRSHGSFGSTQATILGLQASTQYAYIFNSPEEEGDITISINGAPAASRHFNSYDKEDILIKGLSPYFTTANQHVHVEYQNCKNPLNYALNLEWITLQPPSNPKCPVVLSTEFAEDAVRVNETVRLNITVKNKTGSGLPMTMVTVGIPGGVQLQPWQLKSLKEEGIFDYYEIVNGYLILYFTEMGPKEEKQILLDLRAEIPGIFRGQPNSAYLYYMDEAKHWLAGNTIHILE